jgi:hypothetical protein
MHLELMRKHVRTARFLHCPRSGQLLLGILASTAFASFAQTPPPASPFDAMTWTATRKAAPSSGVRMGTLFVRFEKTTLDDVRRAAAVGAIAHRGDAGESVYWLCYTSLSKTESERIWVVSHGEMGGPEHYVTDVSAEVLTNGSATADCPALPGRLEPLSLDNHVWLGASERAATRTLGASSFRTAAWRSYDFQRKVPGKCEGGAFDLSASLLLHFQQGRVNSLHVGQVTSC